MAPLVPLHNASQYSGAVLPIPTSPKKCASTNRDVEDAWNPFVNQIGVEVEFAVAPKFVVDVNGKATVDEMTPVVEL